MSRILLLGALLMLSCVGCSNVRVYWVYEDEFEDDVWEECVDCDPNYVFRCGNNRDDW